MKSESRLVVFAWDLSKWCLAPEISLTLVRLLSGAAKPSSSMDLPVEMVQKALEHLDEEAHRQRLDALRELGERNNTLIARQLASLDAYYQNRLQRVQLELAQVTEQRITRMKEAERARIERDYDRKRKEIEARREADIISQRVAAGILEVLHGK